MLIVIGVSTSLSLQFLSFPTTGGSGMEQITFPGPSNQTSNDNALPFKSNSVNISGQKPYAFFMVLRLGNDTDSGISNYLTFHKVDYQVISRHAELQKGMQAEDTRIANLESFCKTNPLCHSLQPRPYMVPYGVFLDHLTIQSLLGDTDLHFHNSPSLSSNFKETQLDMDGTVYSVGLQCSVEDCK